MKYDRILLDHGSGGLLMNNLIHDTFVPVLKNDYLASMGDSAVISIGEKKMCFTTDSYVVDPIFFPGGDIGTLAVNGTVNDISMCGGRPEFLSMGLILEEGFPMVDLKKVIASVGRAAREAGVMVVTGDTKVVARGAADKLFINTSGIGIMEYGKDISARSIRPGDTVIVNGTMGDHGAAILSTRQDLGFRSDILSDCAPLNGLVEKILQASPDIRFMRDATRGGLGAILVEVTQQTGLSMEIREREIPVRPEVKGLCEILGLDPLFIANEGKMVVICPEGDAPNVLAAMKSHPFGKDAAMVGHISEGRRSRVTLHTVIGGSRELDLPEGELIPRIC